jgi:hypothetical protein
VDVLDNNVAQDPGLSHTRLADDEHVVHSIERGECKFFFASMGEDATYHCAFAIEMKDHIAEVSFPLALP